jgi:hypothetical protein
MQALSGLWEFLGEWEGLGAIAAVVALVGIPATIYGPAIYRARRQLTYAVIEDTHLAAAEDEVNYKLRFGDSEIPANQVRRVVIELRNDGILDVEPSNYIRPISFTFGKSTVLVLMCKHLRRPSWCSAPCSHRTVPSG